MTVREQVARTRSTLRTALGARAALIVLASAIALLALSRILDRAAMPLVSVAVVTATLACALIYRKSWPSSDARVALWVEEQLGGLGYRVVSAVDPACAPSWPMLDRQVGAVDWPRLRRGALLKAVRWPLVVLTVAIIATLVAPALRALAARTGVTRVLGGSGAGQPLDRVRVDVQPPSYVADRERTLENPADVDALVGSRLIVRGDAGNVRASLAARVIVVDSSSDGWRFTLTMPESAAVLELRAPGRTRLIALLPRADSTPVVTLLRPQSDTTLRGPVGRIALVAEASDDIGLTATAFEYVISSGSGESFSFRAGLLAARRLSSERTARFESALDVAALRANRGDVIHYRAVATDALGRPDFATRSDTARDWRRTGWRGASETRAVRIARPGEYDSLAIEGAPPPEIPPNALSQRMLLQLSEALEARRRRISRDTLTAESRRIALDQARLRKRVGQVVFSRLGESEGEEGDDPRLEGKLSPDELLAKASEATNATGVIDNETESPVVAVNRPLLEAYNYMWDAQRELEVGEPGRAVPPMKRAIAALEKARAAERLYLRGRPPAIVVDIAKVRMSGADKPSAVERRPRTSADSARQVVSVRLLGALALAATDPAAARDSIVILRVQTLPAYPSVAAALGDAVEAMRRGVDATLPLARARRALLGDPVRLDRLGTWGAAW